ncbi:hypothetical protein HKX48_005266 [Thoreauomyces humboldtii]|nr:hypothetical protein HKX48_005266 [Thoreauomyces humboldtii]
MSRDQQHYYTLVKKPEWKLDTLLDCWRVFTAYNTVVVVHGADRCETLAAQVNVRQFITDKLHGEMDPVARAAALEAPLLIIDSAELSDPAVRDLLLAREIFFNYDFPLKASDYASHRTRRPGKTSLTISFVLERQEGEAEPGKEVKLLRDTESMYNFKMDAWEFYY